MSKIDYGMDLTDQTLLASFNAQECPRCKSPTTSLQSTSESGLALERRGKCYWQSGEHATNGFTCNKGAREKVQR